VNQHFWNYVRHLSKQDTKTLSQKALKTAEEVGEMAKVVLPFDNAFATNHRFVDREAILEEAVDVVLTGISVAYDLDCTDEEIEQMFARKAEKWARLQAGERDMKYPIPFEIHITVKLTESDHETFAGLCYELGVKPVFIENHLRDGVAMDVLTASKHYGTNRSAYEEAMRLKKALEKSYQIVRVKIETVPWHPASPKSYDTKMPENCYFEAHIPVRFRNIPETYRHLRALVEKNSAKLSQDISKRHDDGTETLIITYRTELLHQEAFESWTEILTRAVASEHSDLTVFYVGKPHKEFSVYDTNLSHDAKWLKEN